MKDLEEIIKIFPRNIQDVLRAISLDFEQLQEIRLRAGRPLLLQYKGQECWAGTNGKWIAADRRTDLGHLQDSVCWISSQEIRETMEAVGRYSLYAHEEELRQGFLTIQGGHRVGVAGKTILDGEKVRNIKYISFLNIRLSHEIKGCADPVMPFLYHKDGQVCHTLIISPPRCGKTTLLRDMIRQISDGYPGAFECSEGSGQMEGVTKAYTGCPGHTVGVVDERSEIAGCYLGIPSNDLGMRTDVLDCCPKAEGMMMLIRSMAPEVVAVDEIGSYEEIHAIETVLYCGCKLLATVHGNSMEDVKKKPLLQKLIQEQVFERYVILQKWKHAGQIRQILDQQGRVLWESEG